MLKRIVRRCYHILFKPVLVNLHENERRIKRQLERMEDRITRLENGLVAAGLVPKETWIKTRHLDTTSMTLPEAFDYIYEHRLWAEGKEMPSGTGSYGFWAERFIDLAKNFIETHAIRSVTDIGCGDFNVGSQLSKYVDKYNALDVSAQIISRNKTLFQDLPNVTFQQANACQDGLPQADMAIIRQVLQHLSNEQIEAVLRNAEKTGFKYVLVAEHLPPADKLAKPNIDMLQHSEGIRLAQGSGILIHEPPFSRPARKMDEFPGEGGNLAIYLWEPGKDK